MTRDVSDPHFSDLRAAFADRFGGGTSDLTLARAPGRVNLIGGHTDYNDGFVLPITIDRAVYVALRRRDDMSVRLRSLNFAEEVEYGLREPPVDRLPQWAKYVAGVTEELRSYGLNGGFEGLLWGNVPLGSGLSSSAALEIAVAEGLKNRFRIQLGAEDTALLCQTVEHDYVGVKCGIMDQMAVRLGRSGHVLFLDCRHVEYDHMPLPLEGTRLVIADSQVNRALAESKYNERRTECDEGVAFFQQFDSSIEALRDVNGELFDQHAAHLPETIRRRCRHVITENERVRQSANALREGDLSTFGSLMNASHESLRDEYAVSTEELDYMVGTARATDGVYGARMTGAGFGGCMVCLAAEKVLPALKRRLTEGYEDQFGWAPDLYVVEQNLEVATIEVG